MEVGFTSIPLANQQLIRRSSAAVQQLEGRDYTYATSPNLGFDWSTASAGSCAESGAKGETIDLWQLPLTVRTLQRHISIEKLSRLTLPNFDQNFEFPSDLKVLRHIWGKTQEASACPASRVKIPAKTLAIIHSKSLDVGIPQYFTLLGPGPNYPKYEVRIIRASKLDGQDEILLNILPIQELNPISISDRRFVKVSEFYSTLQARFCKFSAQLHIPASSVANSIAHSIIRPIGNPALAQSNNLIMDFKQENASRRRKQLVKANPAVSPTKPTPTGAKTNQTPVAKPRKRAAPVTPLVLDISKEESSNPSPSIQRITSGMEVNRSPTDIETEHVSANTKEALLNIGSSTENGAQENTPGSPRLELSAMDSAGPKSSKQTSLGKSWQEPVFSPEDVIKEIREMITNTPPDDTHFATIPCEYIRVGSYKVVSEQKSSMSKGLIITMSTKGIFFEVPHSKNDGIKECVIVLSHIQKAQAHLSSKQPVVFITLSAKHANWLRENLGLTKVGNGPYFCPTANDDPESYVILKLDKEGFRPFQASTIKKSLTLLEEIDEECASSKLIEASSKSKLQGAKRPISDNFVETSAADMDGKESTPPRKLRKTDASARANELEEEPLTPIFNPFTGQLHKLLRRHNLELSNADLMSLGGEQFLNDQIIDYWLQEILSKLSEEDRRRTHVFSSFFYKRLTTKSQKRSYSFESDVKIPMAQKAHLRVKNWTKNVDLFSKDFIIVPVIEDAHWYVVVICFPSLEGPHSFEDSQKLPYINDHYNFEADGKTRRIIATVKDDPICKKMSIKDVVEYDKPRMKQPCILIFDSLRKEDGRNRICVNLRHYIQEELKEKKGIIRKLDKLNFPGFQPTVPQQPNYCDCGIFVLKYVEAFFESPIDSFDLPIPGMQEWFPTSIVETKRKEIYDSIVQRIKTEAPEKVEFIPQVKFIVTPCKENISTADAEAKGESAPREELDDIPDNTAAEMQSSSKAD